MSVANVTPTTTLSVLRWCHPRLPSTRLHKQDETGEHKGRFITLLKSRASGGTTENDNCKLVASGIALLPESKAGIEARALPTFHDDSSSVKPTFSSSQHMVWPFFRRYLLQCGQLAKARIVKTKLGRFPV